MISLVIKALKDFSVVSKILHDGANDMNLHNYWPIWICIFTDLFVTMISRDLPNSTSTLQYYVSVMTDV